MATVPINVQDEDEVFNLESPHLYINKNKRESVISHHQQMRKNILLRIIIGSFSGVVLAYLTVAVVVHVTSPSYRAPGTTVDKMVTTTTSGPKTFIGDTIKYGYVHTKYEFRRFLRLLNKLSTKNRI